MNHSTMVFLVVQLMNYFITLETVCRVESLIYTQTLSMLFMSWPGHFSLNSQKTWGPLKWNAQANTENLMKEIKKNPKALLLQITAGRTCWFMHFFKMLQLLLATISLIFSSGTIWVCKKHNFLQTLPTIYPQTITTIEETGTGAVSLKARRTI